MNPSTSASAQVVLHVLETSWQAIVLAGMVVLLGLVLRDRLSARWRCTLWLVVVARLLPQGDVSQVVTQHFDLVFEIEPRGPRFGVGAASRDLVRPVGRQTHRRRTGSGVRRDELGRAFVARRHRIVRDPLGRVRRRHAAQQQRDTDHPAAQAHRRATWARDRRRRVGSRRVTSGEISHRPLRACVATARSVASAARDRAADASTSR